MSEPAAERKEEQGLCERLKVWRGRRMTQTKAAGMIGVSLRTYQGWEQGAKEPVGLGRRVLEEWLAREAGK